MLARKLQHPHIVPFVGGFIQDDASYLLFQWADGGNLCFYWSDKVNWSRDRNLISWTINQIGGLFAALDEWHTKPSRHTSNGRHGDLKPENILRSSGIFQITDLGLAKVHSLPTHARNKHSSTPGGTFRYRPPEFARMSTNQRVYSRSYDMWGMGCITLEWIIWLVYGIEELTAFYKQAFPDDDSDAFCSRTGEVRPINPVVTSWMKHMTDTCLVDGEQCYSIALRSLLIFVRDKLLVPYSGEHDITDVCQSSNGDEGLPRLDFTVASHLNQVPSTPQRAKSTESRLKLEEIGSTRNRNPNYMFNPNVTMKGTNSRGPPLSTSSSLKVPSSTSSSRQEVNGPHDKR
jgi:serine/threonine protein kinase